jgi:hypothetical protein
MESRAWWRRALDGWLVIAARFGFVQTLVIVSIVYLLLLGPIGVVANLFGADFLNKKKLHEPGSAWSEADTSKPELERLQQQF